MNRRSALAAISTFLAGRTLFAAVKPVTAKAAQTRPPKRGKYLETMTWKDAEAALQKCELVLIPCGARTKEHGLHLPLNTDWIQAEYLTRRVLDELDLIALPTLQYGYFPAFTEYPGSVNISRDTFRDFVIDICRSMSKYGPKKFYILNTGLSTIQSLKPAKEILAQEKIQLEYTDPVAMTAEVEKKISKQERGTHADEIETSVMLYMAPDLVKMKLAQKDANAEKPQHGGLTRDPKNQVGVYSPTGAWGDPTLATREKGRIVTETVVEKTISFLREFQSRSS